jgi:hypothetical protein
MLVNDLRDTGKELTFSVLVNVLVILPRHMHELCRKHGGVRANPWVAHGATTHCRRRDVIPRRTIDEHHLKSIIHYHLPSDGR